MNFSLQLNTIEKVHFHEDEFILKVVSQQFACIECRRRIVKSPFTFLFYLLKARYDDSFDPPPL